MNEATPAAVAPTAKARPTAILAVVCSVVFFGVLNASAVNVILPDMGRSYTAEPASLGWVMSIFLLTYGVAIPLYGRLADRFGARPLFLFGIGLFGLGSLLCAVAPNLELMLSARVVQALGGASFPGLGMALASQAFPPERRGFALGSIAAVMGLGSAVGPIAGGLIADLFDWRILFGVSALVWGVAPFAARLLPRDAGDAQGELDLPGGALLALGVSGTLFTVAELGRRGIGDPAIIAALGIALGALIVGVVHHRRAATPFLSRELLAQGDYMRVVAMGFLNTGAYLGALLAVPLLLATQHELGPFEIGLAMVPGAIGTGVLGVLAGKWVDARGPRTPILVGAVGMALALLSLSSIAGQSLAGVVACVGVLGASYSLVNTPLSAAITLIVRPQLFANALSLHTMVFFTGGSFGSAAAVAVVAAEGLGAWNPLFEGAAAGYSNAYLLLAAPPTLVGLLGRRVAAGRR